MKTEEILNGIWAAEDHNELQAHLDLFQAALERNECNYGYSESTDIEVAIIEVLANNFERVVRV